MLTEKGNSGKYAKLQDLHNFVSMIKLKHTLSVFDPQKIMSTVDRESSNFLF